MRIAVVAALAENRVIGRDNALPWHLSGDLRHFKSLTMGKAIIMGRNTYESIGRPLPGRRNIVITRDTGYSAPGCQVVHTTEQALEAAQGSEEAMIIGGATLYEQMLDRADRLYLTRVRTDVDGDVLFPEIRPGDWREVERESHRADARNEYDYDFIVMDRVRE